MAFIVDTKSFCVPLSLFMVSRDDRMHRKRRQFQSGKLMFLFGYVHVSVRKFYWCYDHFSNHPYDIITFAIHLLQCCSMVHIMTSSVIKLWGQLWTTLHSFCTQNFILLNFLSIRVFSWPDFIILMRFMPCRIHPCLSHILISEKEIVSVTRKVEKHEISCTKHMESCPQLATILNIALWGLLDFKEL